MKAANVRAIKLEALEQRFDSSAKEYGELNESLRWELNPAYRVRIEAQIEELDRQMEKLDAEIQRLRASGADSHQLDTAWESNLPEIDFSKAFGIFDQVRSRLDSDGGAALFLLQNGNSMGARWCVKRIKEALRRGTQDFRHFPVGFPHGPPTESALLVALARHFGVNPAPDELGELAQAVVDRAIGSLQAGSVIMVEVTIWDNLAAAKQFLPWFLANLWGPLVRRLPHATRTALLAKVIAVIVVNTRIAPECLAPPMRCSKANFDGEKILELPLQIWNEKDILKWLIKYSPLAKRLKSDLIGQAAKSIFVAGEGGKPNSVYLALMDYIKQAG